MTDTLIPEVEKAASAQVRVKMDVDDVDFKATMAAARGEVEALSAAIKSLPTVAAGDGVKREPLTYEPGSPNNFLLDVGRSKGLHDEAATQRLARHAVETRTNPNNVLGTGGEFAPPGYIIDMFSTPVVVGRHFADLVGSRPMPRGMSQINIPRIASTNILGEFTGIQAANGDPITDVDPTTSYKTSSVVSITGDVILSQQLYDQTPDPGFEAIATDYLVKDYNAILEGQMITGTGTNGQLLGLSNIVPSQNSVNGASVPAGLTGPSNMIAALWPLLGQAAAAVGNNRGHRPDFWLMAPRRWFAIAASLDQQSRPIMSPQKSDTDDTASITQGGPHAVGNIHGVPVYTDGAIATTLYTNNVAGTIGAVADTVYCGRSRDMYLFESAPMIQASVNATAGTLEVRVSLHRYAAFVGNVYTSALGRVTSIPQPTNY